MAIIMENDMIKGSAPLRPDDLKKLSELPRYQISRKQASIWAHRDIKFLTYDDTDLRENGYDSDDEEGMLNLAMKMSQGSSAGEGSPKDGKYTKHSDIEETQAEASTSRPIGDDEPKSCKFCSFIPEFPHSWRPRKFRLVQPQIVPDTEGKLPGGEEICSHYVAISYCWPVPQKDEHGKTILTPGTYQVRDLDGTVRTNRCLDDVLDRAVDFAVSCGIRLIWIDQECLPQPNEESPQEDKVYQELGLQAMDIVYNRAVVTAGLLNTEITSQTEIDAINTLMSFGVDESERGIRWEGPGPAPRTVDFQLLNHVLNFLERISADRWYTRCWVAQESLSAGKHLMVVLRRGPGLSYRSRFEFQGRARPPLSSSTRDLSKRIQSNNVAIPVEYFHRLIQAAKFFLQRDFTRVGSALVRYGHERISFHHAGPILAAAEALHLAAPNPRTLAEKVLMVGSNNYGPRQTVDAAGALTLLRTRECRDVQDRIAIVANMCNFENRLDTRALGRNCKSLRLALIALTVLNGDYSLLAPEAYALEPWEDENHNMTSQPIMRWLWPLNLSPHLIDYCKVRPGGYISASTYNFNNPLATDGLQLSAYLWMVDGTVDFTPIQLEWAERWNSLKCLKVQMMNIKGETPEEFEERRRQIVDHLSREDVLHKQIRNAPNLGHHHVEECDDDSSFRPVAYVDALRIEGNPAARRLVADIIFAILRYLFLNADSEPRAIALANSIWHSVRVDAISENSDEELPDNIGDWLFCHPVVVDNPYALLQLDKDRESSFSQFWFIERIMRDGCLWVGHMANSHERADLRYPPEREAADLECSEPSDAKGKAPADHDGADSATASSPSHLDRKPRTILQRQLTRKMLAMLSGMAAFTQTGNSGIGLDRRNLAAFADALWYKMGSHENEERLAPELVSAFDIDGPCLLAIPYNGEWEMLPRPSIRSMSICWVIERASHKEKEDRREDNSGEHLDSDSRMKWSVGKDGAEAEGNVLDEEGWISSMEADTSAEQPNFPRLSVSESSSAANARSHEKGCEEDPEPSYRVLNKVQGLWQIMPDMPVQKYTFI